VRNIGQSEALDPIVRLKPTSSLAMISFHAFERPFLKLKRFVG
jgi:hypothetical protein